MLSGVMVSGVMASGAMLNSEMKVGVTVGGWCSKNCCYAGWVLW